VSISAGSWSFLHQGARVQELDPAECRQLLESTSIGRLGYCTDQGLRIVPMNYTLVGDSLTFRTGATTEASWHAVFHDIAFEVDSIDVVRQTGWSVLVVGQASLLQATSLRMLDLSQTPHPWAGGERSIVAQLPLRQMTGRRVHPV
jgi:nitroimidazol reductase NimA-like FMN-containing flavoprotein (pyridoxamine 5'-phosphate oxidase superfamily)